MRKSSAVLATLSLVVLTLTGCATAPNFAGAACERAASSDDVANAVTVTGDLGSAPDTEVFAPAVFSQTSSVDVIVGSGRPVINETQVITAELSIYSAKTGKKVYATAYADDTESLSNIATLAPQFPGIASSLECATEGSRIAAGFAPDGIEASTKSGLGLTEDEGAIVVIDLLAVFPSKAEGALQFNDARNLPTVVRAPDGTPGIIIPETDAPDEQVEQVLIRGDGDAVGDGQVPVVNLTVVGWDDREVVTTTWGTNPSLDLTSTAPEVAAALIGTPVGSQVLIVTPATSDAPAYAYVIDILGAVTAN